MFKLRNGLALFTVFIMLSCLLPVTGARADNTSAEPVIIDDRDSSIFYSAVSEDDADKGWVASETEDAYKGTHRHSSMKGVYAELTFSGASIEWLGRIFPYGGIANIYIDGKLDKAVDTYSSEVKDQQVIYSKNDLSNAAHTIKVEVTAGRSADALGSYIDLDAFRYSSGSSAPAVPMVITSKEGSGPVAYFSFDSINGGKIKEIIKGIQGTIYKGSLVDGKFGKALNFNGVDSYAKIDQTIAEMNAFTISLWVKYRDLNSEFNSLLHCDGWQNNALHMSVRSDGALHSGVFNNMPDDIGVSEPGVINNGMLNKWQHLALTYDAQAKTSTWYLNGKAVYKAVMSSADSVKLGPLDFGAWERDGEISRFMNGTLDEVLVYNRVLNADEIGQLATAASAFVIPDGTETQGEGTPSATAPPVAGQQLNYYVSPSGDDNNPGTIDKPFATVAKARDTIRAAYPDKMPADINVFIRGGDYYLSSTLEFNENDSGKSGYKVYYRNYQGETPYIHGGALLGGWMLDKGNIYKVNVDENEEMAAIYENGVMGTLARYPNSGYSIAKAVNPLSKKQFRYDGNDVPSVAHQEDIEVQIWPGGDEGEWNWFRLLIKPSSIDAGTKAVTLSTPAYYNLGTGSRYFVQNAYEFLDQAGEFFLDKSSSPRVLYYWPRSALIDKQVIVKPFTTGPVISLDGASKDKMVHDIVFQGLTIGDSDRNRQGVYMNYSNNITIDRCMITNTGDDGIAMQGIAQNNTVSSCDIHDIGFCGVSIHGSGPSLNDTNNHNKVTNCHIYNVGLVVGHGSGIDIEQSSNNTISYNRITDCPKAAILLAAPQLKDVNGLTIGGVVGSEETYRQFTHADNNVIEYNDISQCMTDTQDNGPIYIFCANKSIIRNNIVHDCDVVGSPGFGIYLDGHADDILISKNLIYNLQLKGSARLEEVISLCGFRDIVSNNYMVNNKTPGHAAGGFIRTYLFKDNTDHVVEKNIYYAEKGDIVKFEAFTPDTTIKAFDFNNYFFANNQYKVYGCNATTWDQWRELDNKKYDRNSIAKDPEFMDIANNDFRLAYDSPAYALGIEDLDLQNVGLKSDFAFADLKDALNVIYVRKQGDQADRSAISLPEGQTAQLAVMGRTVAGYAADLSKAVISYSSDDKGVATVDSSGLISQKGKGIAKITVTVTQSGVKKSKDMFVFAGGAASTATEKNAAAGANTGKANPKTGDAGVAGFMITSGISLFGAAAIYWRKKTNNRS